MAASGGDMEGLDPQELGKLLNNVCYISPFNGKLMPTQSKGVSSDTANQLVQNEEKKKFAKMKAEQEKEYNKCIYLIIYA